VNRLSVFISIVLLLTLMYANPCLAIDYKGCKHAYHHEVYDNGGGAHDDPCEHERSGMPCFWAPIDGCPENCLYEFCFTSTEFECEWTTLTLTTNSGDVNVNCGQIQPLSKHCWNNTGDGFAMVCDAEPSWSVCNRCLNVMAEENEYTENWQNGVVFYAEWEERCDC